MSSPARTEPVERVLGAVAARILSGIAWVGAHSIYVILLLLYRVNRKLLIACLIALPLLVIALIWIVRNG